MIAITNRLPVKEGAADRLVSQFSEGHGSVQDFSGFRSMEVLRSEDDDEVMVITWWDSREDFERWVNSDDFQRAHAGLSGQELLSGRPQMGSYEVAVERRKS